MSSNLYPQDYAKFGPPQEVQDGQILGFNALEIPQGNGLRQVDVTWGPEDFGNNYHLAGSSVNPRGDQGVYDHNLNRNHVATPANINSASSLMMDADVSPGLNENPLSSVGVPDQHLGDLETYSPAYYQHKYFNGSYHYQQKTSTGNLLTGTTFWGGSGEQQDMDEDKEEQVKQHSACLASQVPPQLQKSGGQLSNQKSRYRELRPAPCPSKGLESDDQARQGKASRTRKQKKPTSEPSRGRPGRPPNCKKALSPVRLPGDERPH